jgi:2-oxoglutarate ferredoxin oxidoreductase subunit alpha
MDVAAIETLIAEQFEGKDKLIAPNVKALHMGIDYVKEHLAPLGLRVEKADKVGDRIFIDGNSAAALGAVYGGATVCAWYPITPSTALAEAFMKYCRKLRMDKESGKGKYAIVQGEDELASIGIVMGAGWNGARAFTCTSGPGVSLMTEFLGLGYYAEIPAVVMDVQRGGPSTGMPTRTQQADLIGAAYASHGDTKHPMLFPQDPGECFEMSALSFDIADRLQTPVFLMLDLDIGMNDWLCKPFAWDDKRQIDRGKVMTYEDLQAGKEFARYTDFEGDGIGARTYPGTHPTKGSYFTRGSSHDRFAKYSENGTVYVENMQRLLRKFETAKKLIPAPVRREAKQKTKYGVLYFGSTTPSMHEALEAFDAEGIHLDAMRLRGFPFADEVEKFVLEHEQVFFVEQNRDSQCRTLLVTETGLDPARIVPVLHYDGTPITARFIIDRISALLKARNVAPLREVAR